MDRSSIRYEYQPLSGPRNIRVLHLQPGQLQDPLRASIHIVALDDGDYEALSYSWQGTKQCQRLETDRGNLYITVSLRDALRRLRLGDRPRVLWADAVCINQTDNQEKGRQIRLMSDIFSKANVVVAYLGEPYDDSYLALALLEQISRVDIRAIEGKYTCDKDLPKYGLPLSEHPAWRALWAFWRRPWFRRIWVVPEFMNARIVEFLCGTWEGDWTLFDDVLDTSRQEILDRFVENEDSNGYIEGRSGLDCMTRMVRMKKSYMGYVRLELANGDRMSLRTGRLPLDYDVEAMVSGGKRLRVPPAYKGGLDLLSLLTSFPSSEATRQRDRLFALLSLASGAQDESFDPDYSSPLEDIVKRFAKTFVRRGDGMQLLYLAGMRSQPERFASWIPNWIRTYGMQGRLISLGHVAAERSPSSHATPGSQASVSYDEVNDSLIAIGGIIDTVKWTSGDTSQFSALGILTNLLYMRHSDTFLPLLKTPYPTGESIHEVQWRTLVCNLDSRTWTTASLSFGDIFSEYRQLLEDTSKRLENITWSQFMTQNTERVQEIHEQTHHGPSSHYARSMNSTIDLNKLCVTSKGYFGQVPEQAKPGDLICLLEGGTVPFIIRRSESRIGSYRLVGECYIHGIMNGEAYNTGIWREEIYIH